MLTQVHQILIQVFHQLTLARGCWHVSAGTTQRVALAGAEFTVQVWTLGCSGAIWDLGDTLNVSCGFCYA